MQLRAILPRGRRTVSGSTLLLLSVLVASLLILASTVLASANANTDAPNANSVRISQLYGGGGATTGSPTYQCDYIELFNNSASAVNLSGWSVQYASATGAFSNVDALGVATIAAHSYVLIREACGSLGAVLPYFDDSGALAMGASNGKIAVVSNSTAITGLGDPDVIDFVGYGTATTYEGSGAAPGLVNTTAALRNGGGCTDTVPYTQLSLSTHDPGKNPEGGV